MMENRRSGPSAAVHGVVRAGVGRLVRMGLLLSVALAIPFSLSGQDALDSVEDLLAEARYADARIVLEDWWSEHVGEPPRRELARGLWYRALLTVDAGMAEMDYRRLVVEFPGTLYAEEALLRLARGAEMVGDVAAAHRYLEILVQDYPGSPHRLEARSMRDRLARLPEFEADGLPGGASAGLPDPSGPPDTLRERAAVDPPAVAADTVVGAGVNDTVAEVADEQAGADAEAEEEVAFEDEVASEDEVRAEGSYAVQLGAFSSPDGAHRLAEQARTEGLDVRVVVVRGSEFFRVRLGAFPTPEAAESRAREVEALGFETVISSDRDREEELD